MSFLGEFVILTAIRAGLPHVQSGRPSGVVDTEDARKRKPTRGLPVAFVITEERQPDGEQVTDQPAGPSRPADRARTTPIRRASRTAGSSLPQGDDMVIPPISVTTSVQVQPTRPPPKETNTRSNVNTGTNPASTNPAAQGQLDREVVKPANNASPNPLLVVTQHSHSIRDRAEKTIWFSSKSPDLLASPVTSSATRPQDGYLYVHTASGDRRQMWMWERDKWNAVEIYHPHPHLTGYVLNLLSNGEPSWVTAETIRTYRGRAKKREQERTSK